MGKIGFLKVSFTVLMAFCSLCFAIASVTFTPHPGYPAPNFFSGTNARAFYKAEISFPSQHLSDAELYVGGQMVHSRSYPQYLPGPPPAWSYNIGDWSGVMFDSTIFSFGETIEIKHRVKVDGIWYEHTYDAPSRNKAFLFGLSSIEGGTHHSDQWATYFSKQVLEEYHSVFRSISEWTVANYFTVNGAATIHHYGGHGNIIGICDGTPDHLNSWGQMIGADIDFINSSNTSISVYHHRSELFENELPPFSEYPAINFTYLQACETAANGHNNWVYLIPSVNGYGKELENQAVLGLTRFGVIAYMRYGSEPLFEALAEKKTVGQATSEMIADASYSSPQWLLISNTMTSDPRVPVSADYFINGNPNTTISGVFTNSSVTSRPFSREIDRITLD